MSLGKMITLDKQQKAYLLYVSSILIGIFSGTTDYVIFNETAEFIVNVFVRIFKFISLPLISLSLIVSLSKCVPEQGMGKLWGKTVFYTMLTTMLAASVALCTYGLISPSNMITKPDVAVNIGKMNFWNYVANLIPNNVVAPFLESQSRRS
ncbi:cation:dicarboxylate symporter family transporter, partial [Candidatus Liberibacter asiaticus]|uniref:cation:dicarboxylate symporter family transporter n=1 Tax=Liberibacter asiaticus TaxID=34021 RepID=UPI0012F48141